MLWDILVILLIVAVAAYLGLTASPLFWLILLLIGVWLLVRHRPVGGPGPRSRI